MNSYVLFFFGLRHFIRMIIMFYCGRMYVSLQQDVYFIIVGHINSTHKFP